jgi:hypothetical protein
VALEDQLDPSHEPKALRRLLARAGGVRDFPALVRRLKAVKQKARAAFEGVVA